MATKSAVYSGFSSSIIETFIDSIAAANTSGIGLDYKNSLYLAFGGTTAPPTTVVDTLNSRVSDLNDVIMMKRLSTTDMFYSAKTIKWTSGKVYGEWTASADQTVNLATNDSTKSHYVINSSNELFICVATGRNALTYVDLVPSTVEPSTRNSSGSPVYNNFADLYKTTDGYLWLYVTTLAQSPDSTGLFKVPQNKSINLYPGAIFNLSIINGGSGQTSCTITVVGDGTGASFTPVLNNGVLIGITCVNPGSGYSYADVVVSSVGGTAAVVTATPTPIWGLGAKMEKDLFANTLTISTTLSKGDVKSSSNVDLFPDTGVLNPIQYYKTLLVFNPTDSAGNVLTDNYIDATQTLTLGTALTSTFGADISSGSTSSIANLTSYGKVAFRQSDTVVKVIQPRNSTIGKNNTKFVNGSYITTSGNLINTVSSASSWTRKGIVLFANYSDTVASINNVSTTVLFHISF